jgi:hypothetical protein
MSKSVAALKYYILSPVIRNLGSQVVNNFKLVFTFPASVAYSGQFLYPGPNKNSHTDAQKNHVVTFQSSLLLFPEDERDIGDEMGWEYSIHNDNLRNLNEREFAGHTIELSWTLYADNMAPKHGTCGIRNLHPF